LHPAAQAPSCRRSTARCFRFDPGVAHWVAVGTKYHPAMARKGGALILASAVLTLAACSGSDGDASPATVPVTVAPTTAAPNTTSATTTTTQAPTTTTDPAEVLAAEVEADFMETFRLTDVAFQDPSDAAKVAAALEGYVESNRDLVERQLSELRDLGRAARPNPNVVAEVRIEKPAVFVASPNDAALLQVCQVDSWIIVEPGAGPDGTDAVVNSDVTSYRSNFVLISVDGRWRIRGSESLGEFPGASKCPAE
jgi:hypothetical protein